MNREKKLIAVIDDEEDITNLLCLHLTRNGFSSKAYYCANTFINELSKTQPDLIILDIMLPDADGIQLCNYLKNHGTTSNIPIILLTAKCDESDKVLGLELGADDYITKPFSVRELIARIKAILRRANPISNDTKPSTKKINSRLTINPHTFEAFVNNKKLPLTTTEFKILLLLAEHPGWVLSRKKILDHIWQGEKIVTERTIDVHIKHLREKLGPEGKIIKNVRGIGYKIEL